MNNHTPNIEGDKKRTIIRRMLHYLGRICLGVLIAFIFFAITAKIMSGSVTTPGEAMSATDTQKYIFGYVIIYGIFTLLLAGVSFALKRFRATALTVVLFLVLGGLGGAAVVVYDTPSAARYDALQRANSCVALVITESGHGTGFSTNTGYLVTNYHVIDGANNLSVHYSKSTVPVIAGFSKEMDIAVLKISEDIPVCRWADSDKISAGSELYAVGWPYNPYGSSTTTKGIYSRTISPSDAVEVLGLSNNEYIQTDTVINPGNSGGPLSNSLGVIGINSGKLSSGGSSDIPEGIGYAISSNWAKSFVDNAISAYEKR